ncbi:acyl-CoA thioesterase [Paramuribaculum intestinale]|uniref:acyl-CoA thioesterase n=1 Tax=Paramuribaculum intestinale TaxID=2094151 RepID=UPI0025A962CF|nr:acyl-CoA thioesterase [Paramuribaculum intestinale]
MARNQANINDYDFVLPLTVRDYELDVQGIVNNANYLHYLEHTRHAFCTAAGMSFASMHERGIDPVLRKVEIEYLTPLRSGDTMDSCLSMSREGAKFIFRQDIFRNPGGEPVVRARVEVVCLEQGRLTRGDALAEAFSEYIND